VANMIKHRRTLAAATAVALAVVPTSASARSPFADESRRAFSLSTGPFFGFGAVVAPLGVVSGGAFTLGARFGGQPTWYSGIFVEGGAVLATSGQTVATILPFEKPALNGTYPFFSLLGALRPGSWVELSGGPRFAVLGGVLAGPVGRLGFPVPVMNARLGPGVEVCHLRGENVSLTMVSFVFSMELAILERRVAQRSE